MRVKMLAWLFMIATLSAQATEHHLVIGPSVSHTNWKSATNLDTSAPWCSGRYQWSGQLGWYMMVTPNVFTGIHTLWVSQVKATIGNQQQVISSSDVAAISGLRYQYSQNETRLWWGINYRNIQSLDPTFLASNQVWGPSWGVSYGSQGEGKPWSWHWGVVITPGYYNYDWVPAVQIPTRTSTYVAMEWKIG